MRHEETEEDVSGEFGQQIDEGAGEEVNANELDKTEVDLDRGKKEFSGGEENRGRTADRGGTPDQRRQ